MTRVRILLLLIYTLTPKKTCFNFAKANYRGKKHFSLLTIDTVWYEIKVKLNILTTWPLKVTFST